MRALWIEISLDDVSRISSASRPVRALWIEMFKDYVVMIVDECRGP